ncbi:MAG: hypothetical protein IJ153_11000 [Clostridia bacterium]|nr:hypothetical protein [Clostridia bacterium]MBQ9212214.1 hypothetical protein [Clostridia bacterium]
MANDENIKGYQFGSTEKRTAEEQRELKSKGGKASGIARRRKRDARKIMESVLKSKPVMDAETRKVVDRLGIQGSGKNKDQYDLELIATAALMQKAMRGDVKAHRLILEIMGEDAATNRERERMEHERQMLEMQYAPPEVADDGFIEALNAVNAFDGPEDVPMDLEDGGEDEDSDAE